jgi:hypothetical protein
MISSIETVEAVISYNVISKFKQNVVKRKGDTLYDLSIFQMSQNLCFDALKLKGKVAIPTLNEILKADFAHSD